MHRLDISEILALLPHRYPMILIDRVIDLIPGEKVVALKNVTINEPFFTGHFPTTPVMPGVLIVEAMGQAGGVLIMSDLPRNEIPGAVYFMGFDRVRFRIPVTPGDQLILEVKIIKRRSKAVKMSATAMVNEKLVAEAEFLAIYGDPV
ncbi:MAG: 3-hydroxyacyl-ACP dehydratase FabZ [Desulfatirhabdiaceae bacterium]|nr:3-hydroxyacyl-ACP dehydratase FabZ [Desulfatirhabdiaceae bacterium]